MKIKELDEALKAIDKGYEAYTDPDGDLFINYHNDNLAARIVITLENRIYLHPLDGNYGWLAVLIKRYLDENGKDMTIYAS